MTKYFKIKFGYSSAKVYGYTTGYLIGTIPTVVSIFRSQIPVHFVYLGSPLYGATSVGRRPSLVEAFNSESIYQSTCFRRTASIFEAVRRLFLTYIKAVKAIDWAEISQPCSQQLASSFCLANPSVTASIQAILLHQTDVVALMHTHYSHDSLWLLCGRLHRRYQPSPRRCARFE